MNNAILMVNSPDLNYYLYLFKTFFILLCITYIDYKVLNHEHASIKQKVCTFIFCVVLSIICSFIRFKFDFFYTIFTLYLLLSIYTSRLFHYSLTYSFLLTLLSIGLNYFILFLCIILNFILNMIIQIKEDYINLGVIISMQLAIVISFFHIKRFKKGLSFITPESNNDFLDISVLIVSSLIIFVYIFITSPNIFPIDNLMISLILFAIIMFITIKRSITLYYKHKLLVKELTETKTELEKKKKEVEELEKENLEFIKTSHSIAHKQKALEYKLNQLSPNAEVASELDLTNDLSQLKHKLDEQQPSSFSSIDKTDISAIDDMIQFFQSECQRTKIDFDVKVLGNIYYMTNHLISIDSLQILLADHIKDAMIAIQHSDNINRSILVKLGLIDDIYCLYVYDSGIEFDKETLLSLGSKPITTHEEDSGTGLGFMNTFDTLNKYSASLRIEEIGPACSDNYTKVIKIQFNKLNHLEIKSYRAEELRKLDIPSKFTIL